MFKVLLLCIFLAGCQSMPIADNKAFPCPTIRNYDGTGFARAVEETVRYGPSGEKINTKITTIICYGYKDMI